MRELLTGALLGWRRSPTPNGIVVILQLGTSAQAIAEDQITEVAVALNDRQLGALLQDLTQAAEKRGLVAPRKRRWPFGAG